MTSVRFGFVYKITFTDRANPPKRADEVSEALKEWFRANDVQYGMGSLGGTRNVYGDVFSGSQSELECVRVIFAAFCTALPVVATVCFGVTRSNEWSITETDWERIFEVNNLNEQDRAVAHAYYAELARWVEANAKKPNTES